MTAEDVAAGFDEKLLRLWWAEAARVDDQVIAPQTRSLHGASGWVQAALRALSGSRFFAGLTLRAMVFDLHQIRRYLTEPALRLRIQQQVVRALDEDTRVIVGHSLGSVAAYEALCNNPQLPVRTLVTVGSPLGIRNLIFDRLRPPPAPVVEGGPPRGQWPRSVRHWTNVADGRDVVALVKDLRPAFGERVSCFLIHNGARVHDVAPYLTAEQTGAAIRAGMER
ncbi:alpha/beta fold hydrolase [Streptomyces violaceus]|uniref:AB hydrolase-1 domain-containing protein n=1 Tax=Streptomyces violaceus TaxID=1936 RepID=A0ABY9UAD3_STRVL|nr:alpha/beta fold hydrolase [Streptomyces janthinus]WND17211.1 hypothetical protein RI060_07560 [Streptomyces janthinus]